MSILQTIECDVRGCGAVFTELGENTGFPGWGHIQGIYEKQDNGQIRDCAHICPACKEKLMTFLNEGVLN